MSDPWCHENNLQPYGVLIHMDRDLPYYLPQQYSVYDVRLERPTVIFFFLFRYFSVPYSGQGSEKRVWWVGRESLFFFSLSQRDVLAFRLGKGTKARHFFHINLVDGMC